MNFENRSIFDRPYSPPQTASGSNQPFCHSTLSGYTHTDRLMDRRQVYFDNALML